MAKKAQTAKAPKAAKADDTPPTVDAAATNGEADNAITMHDELLDVARFVNKDFKSQAKTEDAQKYLKRLITTISELPEPKEGEEDLFEKMMSADMQAWYNGAVKGMQADPPAAIPEPAGFVSGGTKQPTQREAKKAAPPKPKKEGVVSVARKLVIMNADKASADVQKLVKERFPDIKDATWSSVYSDTMSTIKMARELGLWQAPA